MGWTLQHIERLKEAGRIKGYKMVSGEPIREKKSTKMKLPKPTPEGLLFIINTLLYKNIPFVREYQFAKHRRFRFDVAIYEKKIYIEYEGLVKANQNVSGHQSLEGYTSNTEKYNLATSMGWKGLRYTSRNYKDFSKDLEKILQ